MFLKVVLFITLDVSVTFRNSWLNLIFLANIQARVDTISKDRYMYQNIISKDKCL